MGNASMDDTDAIATTTFFFTNDGKSYVPTFNCSIRNMRKCRMTHSSIDVFKHPSSSAGHDFANGVLYMGGFGESGGTGNDATL
jgi:hypothetical protein